MKKNKGAGRKQGNGGKIVLGVVTFLNLALTLALSLLRRRDVIRAVQDEEGTVQVLLEKSKNKQEPK